MQTDLHEVTFGWRPDRGRHQVSKSVGSSRVDAVNPGGDQTDRFFGGREGRKPNSTRDHEQLFTVSCWHDAGRDMTCRVELGRLEGKRRLSSPQESKEKVKSSD